MNYVKPVPKIKAHYAGSKKKKKRHTKTHSATSGTQDACTWCGRGRHDRQQCPARDAVCGLCRKKGHFRAVCHSAKQRANDVHQLEEVDLPYLGYVGAKASSDNDEHWTASVEVDGHSTSFKLDTGAAVSVVSDREPWLASADLQSSNKIMRGPGVSHIAVIGVMDATLTYNGKSFNELYVIQNQECSLLSRRACVGLEMIARVDNVEGADRASDFRVQHPSLFKGIGKLKTEHHITIRPNSTSVCLYTARKIAHPLLPQMKSELQSMVRQEIISAVTVPTQWCSGMVPVPKANGSVRICVDLTQLNKSVQREIHPMSSVDESLAKLGSSKIFTKLDANSGFWQLPLDDESRLLTTFITPYGRYCFNRLPFGISSAPEIFQRTMSIILEGLDGVICHMDDILVHSVDETTHNQNVRAVLSRLQEAGLTLNANKCEFAKHSTTFLGHIIDGSGIQADPRKTTAVKKTFLRLPLSESCNGSWAW